MLRKTSFFPLITIAITMATSGCGGGGSSTPTPAPQATTTVTSSGSSTPVSAPVVVNVGAQPVTGIDINVSTPGASTPPNAQVLGVSALGGGGSAADVGATISRGTSMKVLLFGTGLDGSMTVTIGGPADITISNIRSITATDKTPGIAFDAAVSSSAALGARTVILQATNNDVTTFTGGLEVIP